MKRCFPRRNALGKRTAKIAAESQMANGVCPKKPAPQVIGLTKLNDQRSSSTNKDTSIDVQNSDDNVKNNRSDNADSPGLKNDIELGHHRPAENPDITEQMTATGVPQGDRKTLNETPLYSSIPFLPLPVAIVSLLLNILLPGSGTILAGLAVAVVGKPRLMVQEGRVILSVVINICVGIFQFITTTFFLIGWFWSITWGGLMVMHAVTYRAERIANRRKAIDSFVKKARRKSVVTRRKTISQAWEQHCSAVVKFQPTPHQKQQTNLEAPKRKAKDLWSKAKSDMVG
ncbi:protein SPEC3 [Trichuris trichiura]|uniref:Protein SPEC3 n=1 Tax=Trichuris trichiura TaxID=36087 RepID=A0A077ZHB6_TRITR|nr:protein SPEC3 [Trichuris trichiura]